MKKMVRLLIIDSIISFVLLFSCVTAEVAKQMPVAMFVHSKSDIVNDRILYDKDGKYSISDATELIKKDMYPLIFSIKQTEIINDINEKVYVDKIEYERDMRDLRRDVIVKYIDFYTRTERNYVIGSSDLSYSAGVSATASLKYDRLFEYEISPKNPQARITYLIDPIDLIREHVSAKNDKRKEVVLFSYEIFAPEMFYEHLITSVKATVKIPIIFDGEGGLSSTMRINQSNTFIIRKYNNPDTARILLNSNSSDMFEEINKAENIKPTYGAKLQPTTRLVFK